MSEFGNLIPRIVSRGVLQLRQTAILPRLVNNSLGADAGRSGDVIVVPVAASIDASDVTPAATVPTPTANAVDHVEVRLDNWKKAAFSLSDKDMMEIEARSDFVPLQMANAVQALADAVNKSIFSLAPYFKHEIGALGETPFQAAATPSEDYHDVRAAIKARKILNAAGAPKIGRFGVLDYDMEANALALPQFADAARAGTASVPIDGEIGRKYGIDWFASDVLQRRAGDAGVTVNSNAVGRFAKGAMTIIISAAPSAVAALDALVINDAKYLVTAVAAVTGQNTRSEVTLNRGLATVLADNTSVVMRKQYGMGLIMHRDAVALAMRPLSKNGLVLGAGSHLMAVSDPETGLSLRLEVSRQYKQTVWEFDVLWGVAVVRPELGIRLYG